MCVFPKAPKIPVTPERQATQVPQDPMGNRTSLNARRRRGFWASIMTGPQGVSGPPSVTGTSGTLGRSNY
jgi:hypothetical protein